MKETLIVLLVIGILLALTAFKYRRQISAFVHFWRSIKRMQQAAREREGNIQAAPAGPLVSCARCGK